jgi:hypothetical protein
MVIDDVGPGPKTEDATLERRPVNKERNEVHLSLVN